MANALQMNAAERAKLKVLYKATGIKQRFSVIPDFGKANGGFGFFPNAYDLEPFPTVSNRMILYQKEALPLAKIAITNCLLNRNLTNLNAVTHLITVSCTGMYAPGLDLDILETLGMKGNTKRTCINYMGCYAGFNALKNADYICRADPKAKVLIVSVELCTIHYQKKRAWESLLSNALFSDGAAAVLVEGISSGKINLSLDHFYCAVEPEGKKDMAWQISDFGFEMTLSSYIPDLIKGGIKKLTKNLLKRVAHSIHTIDFFAIHPGGKKILKVIEDELDIPKEANRFAYEILENYGNMSSATIFFVLESLLQALNKEDTGKNVLSFAFGPGLTLESMLLGIVVPSTLKIEKPSKSYAEFE